MSNIVTNYRRHKYTCEVTPVEATSINEVVEPNPSLPGSSSWRSGEDLGEQTLETETVHHTSHKKTR